MILSLIPLPWKIGAGLALVAGLVAVDAYRVHEADLAGFNRATTERAARDGVAVLHRTAENAVITATQASINTVITKAKNEELAPVVQRIAAERVRVGPGICPAAGPADPQGPAGRDGANPPGRLVRPDVERDLIALKLAVEQDLATGRAAQAFIEKNGMVP